MTGPTLLVGVLVICHLAAVLQGIPTLLNGQKIQGVLHSNDTHGQLGFVLHSVHLMPCGSSKDQDHHRTTSGC